tara:strand:- start:2898 stop:3236 length:339 start_codon:yes stop_codon:yes gene_type:complete
MKDRTGIGDEFALLGLTAISGINFKKAAELHVKLNVCGIGDLYDACKEGRVKQLKGWSLSTENRIKSEIELNTIWLAGQCNVVKRGASPNRGKANKEFLLNLVHEQAKNNLQ